MGYHQGRLIDHVHIRVSDLDASKDFYRAVLEAVGRDDTIGENETAFWADEFYMDAAGTAPVSRIHLAFQARDHEAVRRFHAVGLAAGGTDNGMPGYREYHDQYFAAFLLDPDGNNIEAVCDAPASRSADSILIERQPRED